ncbi:unnamed protein product [Clonostachys chloroleuca]|uniref:Ankyrin n=1 Tax=Clonostachys chloroleuca TaxID=1926264 RepID=A0AA35Q0K8_9HYPO|nr:unnamed protein product [Clonostachys chloroleuca]
MTLPTPPSTSDSPPLPDISSIQPLPTYTATAQDDLEARIERTSGLELPILRMPALDYSRPHNPPLKTTEQADDAANLDARTLERDIVLAFFTAIRSGHNELVSQLVSRGLVSPDVTNSAGETPLLAAVCAGNTPMISTLVALGATVNAYGTPCSIHSDRRHRRLRRTPLQLAAQQGRLALVKVLMEDYGADDSLVAPDGYIALRLAAKNGHREIVEYLPARRGDIGLRCKTIARDEWEVVVSILKKFGHVIEFFVWRLPVAVLYKAPKHICQSAWRRRHRFAAWCKRAARGVVKLPSRILKFLREVLKALKRTPEFVRRLARAALKFLKAIPGVVKSVLLWVGRGLKSAGKAVLHVFALCASLIHTAVLSVLSFFRGITPKDVWDGVCYLVKAIFVEAPLALIKFLGTFGEVSYKVLAALFGVLGKVLWYIAQGILYVITWTPKQLWRCVKAFGRLNRKGFNEIMALIDPKRM